MIFNDLVNCYNRGATWHWPLCLGNRELVRFALNALEERTHHGTLLAMRGTGSGRIKNGGFTIGSMAGM